MSPSEARRIHIEAWQVGGMSQAAYCRERGLTWSSKTGHPS